MKCSGFGHGAIREVGAVTPGVCGGCLHMIDDHDSSGRCTSCVEVSIAVMKKWARGEGSPPPGWQAPPGLDEIPMPEWAQ